MSRTMKIFVIVKKLASADESPWIVAAWDEWSVDGNYSGWVEACHKEEKHCADGEQIRVGTVEVPDSFLSGLFAVQSVKGKISQ